VELAKRMARRLCRDEDDITTVSSEAAMHWKRLYDPSRGTEEGFLARIVRFDVKYMYRKRMTRREEFHTDLWWTRVVKTSKAEPIDLGISNQDFALLTARYVEKRSFGTIGRRFGVPTSWAKSMVELALGRLMEAQRVRAEV